MLLLERKVGQEILIGDDIIVSVVAVTKFGMVKIGIDAPREIPVDRREVRNRIDNGEGRKPRTYHARPEGGSK